MVKWGDYCIYEVRYNSAHTHIDSVKAYKYQSGTLTDSNIYPRTSVVDAIGRGVTFVTIARASNGNYDLIAEVVPVKIGTQTFLRTVSDGIERDNLGSLPEF